MKTKSVVFPIIILVLMMGGIFVFLNTQQAETVPSPVIQPPTEPLTLNLLRSHDWWNPTQEIGGILRSDDLSTELRNEHVVEIKAAAFNVSDYTVPFILKRAVVTRDEAGCSNYKIQDDAYSCDLFDPRQHQELIILSNDTGEVLHKFALKDGYSFLTGRKTAADGFSYYYAAADSIRNNSIKITFDVYRWDSFDETWATEATSYTLDLWTGKITEGSTSLVADRNFSEYDHEEFLLKKAKQDELKEKQSRFHVTGFEKLSDIQLKSGLYMFLDHGLAEEMFGQNKHDKFFGVLIDGVEFYVIKHLEEIPGDVSNQNYYYTQNNNTHVCFIKASGDKELLSGGYEYEQRPLYKSEQYDGSCFDLNTGVFTNIALPSDVIVKGFSIIDDSLLIKNIGKCVDDQSKYCIDYIEYELDNLAAIHYVINLPEEYVLGCPGYVCSTPHLMEIDKDNHKVLISSGTRTTHRYWWDYKNQTILSETFTENDDWSPYDQVLTEEDKRAAKEDFVQRVGDCPMNSVILEFYESSNYLQNRNIVRCG